MKQWMPHRVIAAGAIALVALVPSGAASGDDDEPAWKGAESMALVGLAPNPGRCGEPPVMEARFAGDGLDNLGGAFAVTASGCLDPDALAVFDLEATDTFANGDSIFILPGDATLALDPDTCIATNAEPVPFDVGGGTGSLAGATGSGTFHIALNWAPCNGLALPARVWFEGTIST